jgi:hypothetical protein
MGMELPVRVFSKIYKMPLPPNGLSLVIIQILFGPGPFGTVLVSPAGIITPI